MFFSQVVEQKSSSSRVVVDLSSLSGVQVSFYRKSTADDDSSTKL